MTLDEIRKASEARTHCGECQLSREIRMACGSDLMSDVLAFAAPRSLLLTGLTKVQVVRTSELAAACFVRGKVPETATVRLASKKRTATHRARRSARRSVV